jgi:hypothetical protein
LRQSEFAYCNSRFCFLKYTKPVDERNLQTLKVASQACFPATWTNHETNNSMLMVRLAPIGACIL